MTPRWTDAMLRLTLRGGSVYYLQHRGLSSPEPHYFVVLNVTPREDSFLILAMASSKVENVHRRRAALPKETLVEVTPAEYADFSLPSIFDCNQLVRVTAQELLQKLQTGVASEKAQLPPNILDRLRWGILVSPLIEDEVKDLLR